MIPQETKDAITKLFAENLHVNNRCSTLHQSIRFDLWPHSEGHGSGTCENCGLVIIKSLPNWVEPPPREDPFKGADFGKAAEAPKIEPLVEPEPVKRRRKAVDTEAPNEPST